MTIPKKKVLLVAYYYPPIQAAAAYRTASFKKYLSRFGYQVTTLTVRISKYTWNGSVSGATVANDSVFRTNGFHIGEAIKSISKGKLSGYDKTRVKYKSKKSKPLNRLLAFFYDNVLTFPEPAWLWYYFAKKQVDRIAIKVKPDIVLSSAMPISAHLIARRLKSKFQTPWVADYRDLWSKSHINNRDPLFNRIELLLEKKILKNVDALTTVSDPLARKLRQLSDKPVHVITNGYDPDDFNAIHNDSLIDWNWNDARINAVYTGMIHPERQNPEPLLKAIQILIEQGRIQKGDFALRLFGPNVSIVKSLFPSALLDDFIFFGGNVKRKLALHCQTKADILIVLDWMDPRENGVYTTKLFEYIGADKPIISIGRKGTVIDKTITDNALGVTEKDPHKLALTLERFIKNGKLGKCMQQRTGGEAYLKQFTRENQAERLAGILDRVIVRDQ